MCTDICCQKQHTDFYRFRSTMTEPTAKATTLRYDTRNILKCCGVKGFGGLKKQHK